MHSVTSLPRRTPQLISRYDEKHKIVWGHMSATPRPCFNPTLLAALHGWLDETDARFDAPDQPDVHYQVIASGVPGIFNLGGDLDLFVSLIQNQDRQGLTDYAVSCCELVYRFASHLSRPGLKTIALVQGAALGGGFECALSANVLIAERGTQFGFPEIMFNLFPGMGALTLLSRRIGSRAAERMILSPERSSAEELFEQGIVDVLAEPGEGESAVLDFVQRDRRTRHGSMAFRSAAELIEPVSRAEILAVTGVWVDAALTLDRRGLLTMRHIVSRQNDKFAAGHADDIARRDGDVA